MVDYKQQNGQKDECMFGVHIIENTVCLKRRVENRTVWLDFEWPDEKTNTGVLEYVNLKILNFMKPIFYQMPVEKIHLSCSKEAKDKFGHLISNYQVFLDRTNEVAKQIAASEIDSSSYENLLFIQVDDAAPYEEFFLKISEQTDKKVFIEHMKTGFNPKKRIWEEVPLPFNVAEFIAYIKQNKIKSIFSINQYLIESYLNKAGIYLLSCFEQLGIEYVCIDNDQRNADLSKQFFNNNKFRRYSLSFIESKFWDKYYGNTNVKYPTIPHLKVNKTAEFIDLKDDYKIVILSFSRLNQVIPQLELILYVLEHFDENQLFSQFQAWHYSMKYMMRKILNCKEIELFSNINNFMNFGHNITQLFKFEIIQGLKTHRNIEVYGDEYWKFIFPEYYKGWLDKNEQEMMFGRKDCLCLMMNWGYSMFTNTPNLFAMVNRKNPFLFYAPFAKTDEFKGFEHIEYDNISRLNQKIENIQAIYREPELITAIRNQQRTLEISARYFSNSILSVDNCPYQQPFEEICNKTLKEIDRKTFAFIDENEEMMRQMYKVLFGKPVNIDISKSKFYNREYIQRMNSLNPKDLKLS